MKKEQYLEIREKWSCLASAFPNPLNYQNAFSTLNTFLHLAWHTKTSTIWFLSISSPISPSIPPFLSSCQTHLVLCLQILVRVISPTYANPSFMTQVTPTLSLMIPLKNDLSPLIFQNPNFLHHSPGIYRLLPLNDCTPFLTVCFLMAGTLPHTQLSYVTSSKLFHRCYKHNIKLIFLYAINILDTDTFTDWKHSNKSGHEVNISLFDCLLQSDQFLTITGSQEFRCHRVQAVPGT